MLAAKKVIWTAKNAFGKKQKRVNRSTAGDLFIFFLMSVTAILMSFPLVFTAVNSLKPLDELFIWPPRFYVLRPTLQNFTDLFSVMGKSFVPFSRYLFNSIFVSLTGTAGHVLLASIAAYPLAKHKFPGRKIIFSMIILTLMFPAQVLGISRFVIVAKAGLINTYGALIFPAIAGTLGLFLMKQFMEQMPDSILESARIDGAREMLIFFKIIMPNVKPAWLTLFLIAFKDMWNDAVSPQLYIFNEAYKTLPVALQYVQGGGFARFGAGSAATLILILPPILFFVITQSKIIETMRSSGIKE